jgi:hypothetical protein
MHLDHCVPQAVGSVEHHGAIGGMWARPRSSITAFPSPG